MRLTTQGVCRSRQKVSRELCRTRLDKPIGLFYNIDMGKSLHLEWNQLQLQIAKLLSKNWANWKIAAELGCTAQSVSNVKKHIKGGDKPLSLDDAFIAAAPLPKVIGQTKAEAAKSGKVTSAPPKNKPHAVSHVKNAPLIYTSAIEFAAQLQPIPITPDIFVSYMVSMMKGYNGELVDWLSLISRDFWSCREKNMYEIFSGYTPPEKEPEEEVEVGTPAG